MKSIYSEMFRSDQIEKYWIKIWTIQMGKLLFLYVKKN